MSHDLPKMKLDVSGLLDDWGVRSIFKHFSGSTDGSGRRSGAWVAFASGTSWIQPVGDMGADVRQPEGVVEATTHIMFARTTVTLKAEDRVAATGETYEYDISDVAEYPTHREYHLRRVKRT